MFMKLGTGFFGIDKHLSIEEELRQIAKAGFETLDYNGTCILVGKDSPFLKDNFCDYVQNIRDLADEIGLTFNQLHAPMFGSLGEDECEYKKEVMRRSFEVGRILGAKYNVVHPRMKKDAICGRKSQYMKEINLKYYNDLLPYSKTSGVKIALENMFGYDSHRKHYCDNTISNPDEIVDYLNALKDDSYVFCVDTGHFHLLGQNLGDCIRALGSHVKLLHVHDNDGLVDKHQIPGLGTIDWCDFVNALKEIDYSGELCLEIDYANSMENNLFSPMLKYANDVSRILFEEFLGD